MRRPLVVIVATVTAVATLAGCASARRPGAEPPRDSRHTAAGFHTVSYRGLSLEVPDTATLSRAPVCGPGLPATGSLVVPLAFFGAAACPARTGDESTTPPPRPADELTVVLSALGSRPDLGLPDPQHVDDRDAGVTVTASGPATVVATVLHSLRDTPTDDRGCVEQIDPTVAPSNTATLDGSLSPATVSAIVVCEYAADDAEGTTTFWLVGSTTLSADVAAAVAARIHASTVPEAPAPADGAPEGPELRLIVTGTDGVTRTFQAPANGPWQIRDGGRTVHLANDANGETTPLPTPFDRS